MARIIRFKGKRQAVTEEDYLDTLKTVENLIEEARPHHIENARRVLDEMRLAAHFNPNFREETRDELDDLIYQLYEETQNVK